MRTALRSRARHRLTIICATAAVLAANVVAWSETESDATVTAEVNLQAWDTARDHPDTLRAASEKRRDLRMLEAARERRERISRSDDARKAATPAPRLPKWAAACTETDSTRGHANGLLPTSELCDLPVAGHRLRADAAQGWALLNRAYQERFGKALCLTDSYRSLQAQQSLYASKPGLAAQPGTSNHGWGVAVDLCDGVESGASAEYAWLADQAGTYGWVNPGWAQPGGSRPEPWHWEFTGSPSP